MQFQSDITRHGGTQAGNHRDHCPGRGISRQLAVGYWKDIGEINAQWKVERKFNPADKTKVRRAFAGWHDAEARADERTT